jgi:hypothetical protein
MAATKEKGTEMTRRKWFRIRFVALGLAVAAFSAPAAQAKLDEGLGLPKQSEPTLIVSPDDRNVQLVTPTQVEPNIVVSPDDRAIRRSEVSPSQPTAVSSDDGFELGTLGMSGIVLLLAAGGTFVAIRQVHNGRLANA